jgi:CSLREA domain-containing protein
METWLPSTERRPRRACPTTEKVARLRVWLVGLAIALAATGAVKADPAGAAGFPLVVNDTADRPDVSVGNGVCATRAGRCTLRAAIQEANALLGPDTINVPPGVYALEVPSINDDTPSTGDHDTADSVTIVGTGAAATIIDGGFPTPDQPVEARGIDRLSRSIPAPGTSRCGR